MIPNTTTNRELKLELEILEDADYFCSVEVQKATKNNFYEDKEYRLDLIFFLLHVFSISKNRKHLLAADSLVEKAHEDHLLLSNDMCFIHGGASILYAYVKFYELTREEKYLKKSLMLIDRCSDYFLESDQVGESLFLGRSGLLLNILYIFHVSKDDKLLNFIDKLTRKIISNAVQVEGGLAWYNPFEMVIQPLCSFGYGASGIGFVFDALGQYFNHEPFKEVAKKSFFYVNELCYDKKLNIWNDYRKNIVDKVDLSEHIEKFEDGDNSFFEKPSIDHSIAHGSAGILYAQLSHKSVVNNVKTLSKVELHSNEDIIALVHINLELFNKERHEEFLANARVFISKLGYQKGEIGYLYLAILKVSLIKGESCTYQFPKFDLNLGNNSSMSPKFLSDIDICELLTEKVFEKTIQCIKSLNIFDSKHEGREAWINPHVFFSNKINSSKVDTQISNIMNKVFEYEKELNQFRLRRRFNPYWHVKQLIALREKITSLQIPDRTLEFKKITISKTTILRHVHSQISTNLSTPVDKIDTIQIFWKYDLEKGVIERTLGPIQILVDLFRQPKSIKSALEEILNYCELLNDDEIEPLIGYSNSRSRQDLLNRLPFVLPYQVKILIADGVLEFAES